MLGVIGSAIGMVAFGLLFVILLVSNAAGGSFEGLALAVSCLGLAGISAALFELTNYRKR
jgi:hypothetical protein